MQARLRLYAVQQFVDLRRGRKRRYLLMWIQCVQPQRVNPVCRVVFDVLIKIGVVIQRSLIVRVFTDEPARGWIVVSGAIVIQTAFGVGFAGGVLEWVHERPCRGRQFTEGVVSVGVRYRPSRTAQRSDGAQTVGVEVARCAAAQHGQRLVGVVRVLG